MPYEWHFTKDHAKLATSREYDWVIVADINRDQSQAQRGGGAVAFQDPRLWDTLTRAEVIYDPTVDVAYQKLQKKKAGRAQAAHKGGTGVMHRLFREYGPYAGKIAGRRNGVLISNAKGKSVAYALASLEERAAFFIGSGVEVYEGMIIAENSRDNDLEVNPLKAKQLTNFRAAGNDEAIRLTPPRKLSLEQAIAYIDDDELVEVTPETIRLRKRELDPHERKRQARRAESA